MRPGEPILILPAMESWKPVAVPTSSDQLDAAIREYLENRIDWKPAIPNYERMASDERWAAICGVFDGFAQGAGREAAEGLRYFQEADADPEAEKALAAFAAHWGPETFPEAFAAVSPEAFAALTRTARDTFRAGDPRRARCMFSLLQILDPFDPEPLIGQIMIEWHLGGTQRAADLYSAVVDVFQNPLLDLCASDCFLAAGQRAKVESCVRRALETIREEEGMREAYGNLEPELEAMLDRALQQ